MNGYRRGRGRGQILTLHSPRYSQHLQYALSYLGCFDRSGMRKQKNDSGGGLSANQIAGLAGGIGGGILLISLGVCFGIFARPTVPIHHSKLRDESRSESVGLASAALEALHKSCNLNQPLNRPRIS